MNTVAAFHQDGRTPVTTQNPAHPNEIITIYATGLGALNPAQVTGALSTGSPTVLTITAALDSFFVPVPFAGGAPGFAGLNQVNIQIPANARTAPDLRLIIVANGFLSNSVAIPVGP